MVIYSFCKLIEGTDYSHKKNKQFEPIQGSFPLWAERGNEF